jgi:hypothetical protein
MRAAALWLGLGLLAGCSGGTLPGRVVEISGNGLTYQSAPGRFSGSDRFTWTVTSSSALLRFDDTALTRGTVSVLILDGLNQQVVHSDIAVGVVPSAQTFAGAPGDWQVRVDYSDAEGVFHMDAQGSR